MRCRRPSCPRSWAQAAVEDWIAAGCDLSSAASASSASRFELDQDHLLVLEEEEWEGARSVSSTESVQAEP